MIVLIMNLLRLVYKILIDMHVIKNQTKATCLILIVAKLMQNDLIFPYAL